MWTYNRAQLRWTTDIEKIFRLSRNTTMGYCPQSRHSTVALWLSLGPRSCLGVHSWTKYTEEPYSVYEHTGNIQFWVLINVIIVLKELTLNVQLNCCWRFFSQVIFCFTVVVSTVARVDTIYNQERSIFLILLIIYIPGVVGHRWVGTASAEQRNRAALHCWTRRVDDYRCFLWRN